MLITALNGIVIFYIFVVVVGPWLSKLQENEALSWKAWSVLWAGWLPCVPQPFQQQRADPPGSRAGSRSSTRGGSTSSPSPQRSPRAWPTW